MTTNQDLFTTAQTLMPGGVNSPVRAFGSVGGTPVSMVEGNGPYLTDVEGKEYVDLVGSWGPALLGHSHPAVMDAVRATVEKGLGFGTSHPLESELAELVRSRVPGAEMIRMVSTGTEATMTAIRLARGATGKNLVVKFAGCYHGHSDGLLAAAGSGVATLGLPGSAGVTEAQAWETIVIEYNDREALETVFAEHSGNIAAVITEATPANMGVVAPEPGFNQLIRDLTAAHGALMIFDEVMTGFRITEAGYWGASGRNEGWTPDLFTFGKVIGGGLPTAALAGRRDVMEHLAPTGPVYHAGTLSGNPVAMAAGVATLNNATAGVYEHIDLKAQVVADGLAAALTDAGVDHTIQKVGSLFSLAFGTSATGVHNYAEAQAQESFRYGPFFHAMLEQGVYLPPSVFEAWFLSAAHDDAAVDRILQALPQAAQAAADAG
ncbi:glutamate-1-semialdehyde-2,1-aminomutase [Nesterenkonia salmonea]|uniref:Glutamate-1-semialdehyde 2,1-aminomutase n=1 Tax=Nesterenkonia salmonea TaxID=1804987 RepID=A0A5R9B8J3_9MICC|nr:glutamate-1-semialdehyde 2,1-aminomutase [Nesterenkonia salmonea]TLP94406.1 glutamate-1-semialdehyde-2,1-aminomutase [Nesterenkonia salmonea]